MAAASAGKFLSLLGCSVCSKINAPKETCKMGNSPAHVYGRGTAPNQNILLDSTQCASTSPESLSTVGGLSFCPRVHAGDLEDAGDQPGFPSTNAAWRCG